MGMSKLPAQARSRRLRGAFTGLAVVSVFALAACSSSGGDSSGPTAVSSSAAANHALDKYRQNGINIVFISNPPFSQDDGKGNAAGSGPEVMNKILDNLGITKRTYQLVDFATEIPSLTSGRAVLTANNFNANATRCAQVAFTNPIAFYHQGALAAKGNPKNLHSYDDIAKDSSVKIAAIQGDAAISWLQDTYKVPASRLVLFDTVQNALTGVNQGRADVYLNAVTQLNLNLKLPNTDKLEVVKDFKGPVIDGAEVITNASYALPWTEVDLLNAINGEIVNLEKDGSLASMLTQAGYPADAVAKPTDSGKSVNPGCPWPASYVDTAKSS